MSVEINSIITNKISEPNSNVENQLEPNPKIGICGFRNIGNTCYMNSILQLLIHSRLIINFLLSETDPFVDNIENKTFSQLFLTGKVKAKFVEYLKDNIMERLGDIQRKKLNLSKDEPVIINTENFVSCIETSLLLKLSEIINTIIYKGNCSITPIDFKKTIDKRIPSMRGMSQQDSHELLNSLLDSIIEESCIDSEPKINNVPKFVKDYYDYLEIIRKQMKSTNSIDERKKIINELEEYKKNNPLTINKYEGLKYMTKVFENKRPDSLNASTTGYNPLIFNLLTFNINTFKCSECNYEIFKYEYTTILTLQPKTTLKESFENFIEEETIDKKCEICKNNKCLRKTMIWRPGMSLFIQLKRFNNLPNGKVWKNNSDVEIPHQIDLSEYCDNSMKTDTSLNYKYKLKGISNHMGSLQGGHYTADCISLSDNETWYHFDDSSVSRHSTKEIDMSSSYILLYEMVDNN
jgi:ubiquitin C-terminal hydrolase